MRLASILISFVVALGIVGCSASTQQAQTPSSQKVKKFTPEMSSKQVQKKMNWNYCEASSF